MSEGNRLGSASRAHPLDDLMCPLNVQFSQQFREPAGVELVDCSRTRGQLNFVSAIRRQVQGTPVDRLLLETVAEAAHPQTPDHSAHADLDCSDVEPSVFAEVEKNLRDAGHAMSVGVKNLGVKDIAP